MRQIMQKLNTRVLALVMALALLLCMTPAVSAAEDSGSCGKKLEWSFSGDTLTITGSGAMYDYPESTMAPWYEYRREISAVSLPDGLTRIGDLAFYGCTALKVVTIPDSVKEVGWYAFSGCSGMTMLDLSSKLQTIEDGGFRECAALTSVRLPGSLKSIGDQAFYRCESLTEITIPASVTKLGVSAFAFCYDLIRADVQAAITKLPDWTFYGCSRLTDIILSESMTGIGSLALHECTSLTNVEYPGTEGNKEQIKEDIEKKQDTPAQRPNVSDEKPGASSSNTVDDDGDNNNGVPSSSTTTTTQTDNASVSTNVTVTYPTSGGSSSNAQVDVTLENNDGWNEVSDKVTEVAGSSDKTNVDVYIKDDSTLAGGALKDLAGTNSTVTVHNSTGSSWKIDCSTLDEKTAKNTFDLSYERTDATQEQLELMGCAVGYQIRFASNAQINAEVLIKLPVENARKNASLHQKKLGGDLEMLQTVVVDNDGYAHFYLASVERGTTYLIGINVPVVKAEEAIIPEVLHQEYGITDVAKTEYVVTGRTSSWGLSFNQVTWIMIGGMVSVVTVVGVIMYMLNKRKLKMGYIPELDEEDYEY